MPPGSDLGALKPSPIRNHRADNRVAQPDRSVLLEQTQRGLLFETRCGSHRELAAHRQFNPDRQQRSCQHRSWRVTELQAEPGCG